MQPTTFDALYKAVENKEIVSAITKNGTKHRLFIATNGFLCHFARRSSRRGFRISENDFNNYISFQSHEAKTEKQNLKSLYNNIGKYKKLANKASFSNDWIENCKRLPDFETWQKDLKTEYFGTPCEPTQKSLYDYGITTGNKIDGRVISLSRIEKEYRYAITRLREAIKNKQAVGNIISNVRFAGYDMSISVEPRDNNIVGYLSLEYKGCGNGYYYLLINDENFIGYDVD